MGLREPVVVPMVGMSLQEMNLTITVCDIRTNSGNKTTCMSGSWRVCREVRGVGCGFVYVLSVNKQKVAVLLLALSKVSDRQFHIYRSVHSVNLNSL